jgi:dienelactone hydrolase
MFAMKISSKLFFSLISCISLAGCLATQSPVIKRSTGETVPIKLEVHTLPKPAQSPTVIVAHGSGGVSEMHRSMTSTLNKWGYNAVVIDHYTLRGITRHTGMAVQGARGEDRALDFIEAGRWIQQQDWHKGKIAVVGFSQGGGGVMALVNERVMRNLNYISDTQPNPIAVASAFYPSCGITPPPREPSMPTQVHLAEKDDLALIIFCSFRADSPFQIHLYKGATHSFDENLPPGAILKFTHRYDAKVTNESRLNLRRFLDANMR